MGCGASKPPPGDKHIVASPDSGPAFGEGHTSTAALSDLKTVAPMGDPDSIAGLCVVEVIGAHNLTAMDPGGKSDPFVIASLARHIFRTKTVPRSVNPTFGQKLLFFVTEVDRTYEMDFTVYDEDSVVRNDHIGSAAVHISDLKPEMRDYELKLISMSDGRAPTGTKIDRGGKECGKLMVRAALLDKRRIEEMFWNSIFKLFDNDANGKLNHDELSLALHALGAAGDGDEGGLISPRKGQSGGAACPSGLGGTNIDTMSHMDQLFARADTDKSGYIDPKEFMDFAAALTGNGKTLPGLLSEQNVVASIVQQSMLLAEKQDGAAGTHLHVKPEDCIWYLGLLLHHCPNGEFCPDPGALQGSDAMRALILSESHAMTVEGAAGAEYCVTGSGAEGDDMGTLIYYQNRQTGRMERETIPSYIRVGMRITYGTAPKVAAWQLARMTKAAAADYNSKKSCKNIPGFIKLHQLNMDECVEPDWTKYPTFNEFFYRKLRPEARPLHPQKDVPVARCPADARTHVFESVDETRELWIKGQGFTLSKLLGGGEFAASLIDRLGPAPQLVISRLAPQDYHRFHCIMDCKVVRREWAGDQYYTVNPVAIRGKVDVFGENKRCVIEVDTGEENIGMMVYVCIGATMVGSINFTGAEKDGAEMKSGDDMGFFAFGGSTVITVYRTASLDFAPDLALNSAKPIETLTKVGELLGTKRVK